VKSESCSGPIKWPNRSFAENSETKILSSFVGVSCVDGENNPKIGANPLETQWRNETVSLMTKLSRWIKSNIKPFYKDELFISFWCLRQSELNCL